MPNLPEPVAMFVDAARAGNIRELVANFTADATVSDGGREHRGPAIVHWGNWLFGQSRKHVQPIKASGTEGNLVLLVAVSDVERTRPKQLEWAFTMTGQKISALSVRPSELPDLPPPVTACILATNLADLDGLLDTFADNAVVNDQLYEYRGRDAIRQWAAREIIGQHITMHVVKAARQHGNTIVIAHVDGDYDKKGLPDPLVLTFYFSVADQKIFQLIILRNESLP